MWFKPDIRKRFSSQRVMHWNSSPGNVMAQPDRAQEVYWDGVGLLGCPVKGQELDSMILVYLQYCIILQEQPKKPSPLGKKTTKQWQSLVRKSEDAKCNKNHESRMWEFLPVARESIQFPCVEKSCLYYGNFYAIVGLKYLGVFQLIAIIYQ